MMFHIHVILWFIHKKSVFTYALLYFNFNNNLFEKIIVLLTSDNIYFMPESILILITFIVALAIGIFLGKLLFTAKSQSEKSGLEERINGLLGQIEQLKIQFQTERNQFEKSFVQLTSEKENLQKEKESLAIHLAKKENDFDNLWERNKEQKQEVEQLQEKFTKEFED